MADARRRATRTEASVQLAGVQWEEAVCVHEAAELEAERLLRLATAKRGMLGLSVESRWDALQDLEILANERQDFGPAMPTQV